MDSVFQEPSSNPTNTSFNNKTITPLKQTINTSDIHKQRRTIKSSLTSGGTPGQNAASTLHSNHGYQSYM